MAANRFYLRTLALVVLSAAHSEVAISSEFAVPPPNRLYDLQKRNLSHPWLRVTTDSSRLMLRAWRIDELGLGELRSRKSDPPAPSLVAWRSIARLDEVATHELAGKVTGFLVGGTVGLIAGIASSDAHQQIAATVGVAVLGGLGARRGGRIGKGMVHEQTWYVGEPAKAASPPAVDTSAEFTEAPPTLAPPAPTPPPPSVLKACAHIDSDDRIRMQTDFGQFQGFASVVGPEGLEGLRVDHGGHSSSAVPTGLVRWDQIDRIEKRGGSARKGALVGALMTGLLGGSLAAAANAYGGGSNDAGAFAAGAAVGGALGAGVGALLGAPIPAWHLVYER